MQKNEYGEEPQTRLPTRWRVYIDYRKLNSATKKDYYPLPFVNQILEKLSRQEYFYFLMVIQAIIKSLYMKMIKRKSPSLALLELLLLEGCLLVCVMHQPPFKDE